jgi:hypothetical protein
LLRTHKRLAPSGTEVFPGAGGHWYFGFGTGIEGYDWDYNQLSAWAVRPAM